MHPNGDVQIGLIKEGIKCINTYKCTS